MTDTEPQDRRCELPRRPDGGSRGGGALGGAFPDRVGNVAVLHVRPDGKPKFIESKDWGAGRGALLGGVIGIIGGPVGIIAGGSVGALAAKLRDSGFKNDQLEQLGRSLGPNSSAVVVEIAADAVPDGARSCSRCSAPARVVVEDVEDERRRTLRQPTRPRHPSRSPRRPSARSACTASGDRHGERRRRPQCWKRERREQRHVRRESLQLVAISEGRRGRSARPGGRASTGGRDREEQEEDVQDVEEDRGREQRRGADVLRLAQPLEVDMRAARRRSPARGRRRSASRSGPGRRS